jgi:Zn-dependent peptidase ImmA (M78 family)
MPQSLPKHIVAAPGQLIPVVEKHIPNALGYFDKKNLEICINSDLHPVDKHLILLHEMIHVAAEKFKISGMAIRQPSEKYVANLAGTLFLMLAMSGLWSGVSPEEALEYMKQFDESGENET